MSNQNTDQLDLECKKHQTATAEDEEIAEFNKDLSKNFDVLPLFEQQYMTFINMKKYSLKNNEKLRSRWQESKMTGNPAIIKPMPKISDFHFHNCCTKYLPSQAPAITESLRFHLTPGPGVDKYGQRPIPDDMISKSIKPGDQSTTSKNKTKPSGGE